MSQGTMIREQEYGGGAHPKYRSWRVVVSRLLRASLEGVHTQKRICREAASYIFQVRCRHMVYLVWFVGLGGVTATGFLHFYLFYTFSV